MAFTRQYDLVSFNPETATLLINLYTYEQGDDQQITADIDVPVVLPVDALGNVPTGLALTQFLDRHAISITPDAMLQSLLEKLRFGGSVLNANAMYNLTNDVEVDEEDLITIPNDKTWIPVLIFPDTTYNSNNTTFNRSIVAAVGGNLGAPILAEQFEGDPTDKVGQSQYLLLNQYMNGSILHRVHHAKSNGISQEANVTGNIYLLTAPEYIVESWPNVFNQTSVMDILQEGGNVTTYSRYYYIEHQPLSIPTTYARGWIEYNT
jgi:hypothetical protein